ncbi:MAG: folylpolyglutamate synthase/dihydrofolate synthase family protein, partial [Dehalococcoidia bacterium]
VPVGAILCGRPHEWMEMDYQSALDYVLSFSDYERWPGAGYAERWDLRRMEELLRRLGSPHLGRRTVHISGTKGKGSTSAMVASALTAAGFRTGLYTSPHLHTIRERINIDGEIITEAEFAAIVSGMKPAIEAQNKGRYGELSTFEILTALCFSYFQKQSADFQVLEVGLGGRLDATNVVPHRDVSVITSISLDHTAVLGDTVAKIAFEKAGIIKPDTTVVISPQVPQASEVIRAVCARKGARLVAVGEDITWQSGAKNLETQSLSVKGLKGEYALTIPLLGKHQLENAVSAVAALEALGITAEHIVPGLAKTKWPGRLEVLGREPLLIADGAHNGDSAGRLVESIKSYFQFGRAILIMGTSADKNSGAMVAEFAPFFDLVILTMAQHPRATDPNLLAQEFARQGVTALETRNVPQAISEALARSGKRDLICATGSLFLVAEVIEQVKGIPGERYPKFGLQSKPFSNQQKSP